MSPKASLLERFSQRIMVWTGTSTAFVAAVAVILIWLATGPFVHFTDTWQLVINTGTTIITFLMVFLIQRAQNKDGKAVELKLNELVAALKGASNRLIDVENLSEQDLDELHRHYQTLVAKARLDKELTKSHSVEEAELRHQIGKGCMPRPSSKLEGEDRPRAGRRVRRRRTRQATR